MQAIILAAGMGKRLGELTKNNTKCMIKVNSERIIDRLLSQLSKIDLKKIIIVIGYKGSELRNYIDSNWNGIKIQYIQNPIYYKTNNIYSLSLASNELMEDDTILLESDIIVEDSIIKKVISCNHENVAVIDNFQSWMDGTCVKIDKDDRIKCFIPKKDFIYNEIPLYYKTVNIYKFSKYFSKKYYVPFLRAYSTALGNNEYYEQVLRVLTLLDEPLIYGLKLSGEKWYEIDDIQDLDIAESIFCPQEIQIKKLSSRYGGYWRYSTLKDYTYLVNPYFPPTKMLDEIKNSFNILLENYPSGQNVNSMLAAKTFGLKVGTVVVGNGASELIRTWMEMTSGNIGFIYPTFEEYPNRIPDERKVIYQTSIENGFRYCCDDLIKFFEKNSVSSIILINPDNPSGNFLPKDDIIDFVSWTKFKNIRLLIDESFIDFAEQPYTMLDSNFLHENKHLTIMKSISKSYGVPGLRLGILACGSEEQCREIQKNLPIWNINSFGEFFLQIAEKYSKEYIEACRMISIERSRFINEIEKIDFLEPYPSDANFVLCKVKHPYNSTSLALKLWKCGQFLIKDCSNKKGFYGEPFIRLAIKSSDDNNTLINTLKDLN